MNIYTFSKTGNTKDINGDYVFSKRMKDINECYSIVLDCASSKANSSLGAQKVAKDLMKYIDNHFSEMKDMKINEIRRVIEDTVTFALTEAAIKNHVSYDSLGSTMMLTIYYENIILTAHIGDGEIGFLDKQLNYCTISTPENGITKTYTYLTSSNNLKQHIRVYRHNNDNKNMVAMFTDGVSETFKRIVKNRCMNCNEILNLLANAEYEDDASLVLIGEKQ